MNGIILASFGGDGQVRELRDTGQGAQVDHVLPVGEVGNRIVPVTGAEHEGVGVGTAVAAVEHQVVALAAQDGIVAAAAADDIVARSNVDFLEFP